MPFTFKLSQRLARMRCGVALLAALTLPACELPSTNPDLADSPVARVLVSPDSVAVDSNQSYQFRAFGQTTAGDSVAVSVSWSASLGTITPGGLYTADGSTADALITATLTSSPALSGTARVQKRWVVEIVLTPSSPSVLVGGTQQFSAYGRTNTSDSVSVAVTYTATGGTITGSGLYAAGQVPGNYWIVATQDGGSLADTSTVAVSSVPVASVAVTPATAGVVVGATVQLTATPRDSAGNALSGRSVAWSSSAPALATVSSGGVVTGVAAGTATITATSEGQSGTAAVTVTNVPVASVTVSPATASVAVGQTVQLGATLRDASGNVLTGRTVTWTSDNPAVATVSASGLVTGVAVGSVTIMATSEGRSGAATVSVTLSVPGQVTYYSTNFTDGTTGPLDVYAYGGGSCAPSTDYTDPGSAYSMKCTIPGDVDGAAALQAWFGQGKLAGTPKDPSVDQDLYQQVRFVLGPGAAASIGGTSCTAQNPSSQFKMHKSVYGQVGSNTNGWVMSEIAPCTDGEIGMFSEAEMWGQNGTPYPWPGTYPSLNEGTVYDVVYRYHRYTAQNCGTIAVWVNGTKVWDSPCWSYMGTTGGSSDGLLFWDGATYLQDGLGALTVYTLFTRATNYPIGAAVVP